MKKLKKEWKIQEEYIGAKLYYCVYSRRRHFFGLIPGEWRYRELFRSKDAAKTCVRGYAIGGIKSAEIYRTEEDLDK